MDETARVAAVAVSSANVAAGLDANDAGLGTDVGAGWGPDNDAGLDTNLDAGLDAEVDVGLDVNVTADLGANFNMGLSADVATGFDKALTPTQCCRHNVSEYYKSD